MLPLKHDTLRNGRVQSDAGTNLSLESWLLPNKPLQRTIPPQGNRSNISEPLVRRARRLTAKRWADCCGYEKPLPQPVFAMYGECMARLTSTTVRLEEDDIRALKKARAAGHSASELIRKGLRVVASRYYSGRRPPTTSLFESTDSKLGDESLLFKDLKD